MPNISVADFYQDKIITISGVTGFYGKVLLEKILWEYPNIKKINLLIRRKSKSNASDRFTSEVLTSPIFERVIKRCQEQGTDFYQWVFNKMDIFEIDYSYKDVGLEASVLKNLFTQTNVFFHIAASVNWDDPFDLTLHSNVISSINLISLLKQFHPTDKPHFVYISSALIFNKAKGICPELPLTDFANEDKNYNFHIAEIQKINIDELYNDILSKRKQLTEWAYKKFTDPCPYECLIYSGEDMKQQLILKLCRDRTNDALSEYGRTIVNKYNFSDTYTFGKVLTEISLDKFKDDIHISIIRPSAITAAFKEPLKGWVERMISFNPLIVKVGTGKIKVLPGNYQALVDFIPIDFAINQTLIAPYFHPQNKVVNVWHAVTSKKVNFTIKYMLQLVLNKFSLKYFKDYKNEKSTAKIYFAIPCSLALFLLNVCFLITVAIIQLMYKLKSIPLFFSILKNLVLLRKNLQKNIRLLGLYKVYLQRGKWILNYEKTQDYLQQLSTSERSKYNYNIETVNSWEEYWTETHFNGMFTFILKK